MELNGKIHVCTETWAGLGKESGRASVRSVSFSVTSGDFILFYFFPKYFGEKVVSFRI